MNTIEDLRTTLAAHADQTGEPAAVRSAAVRQRVRKARRRRATAVAAVVVAAIASASLAVLMPGLGRLPTAGMPEEVNALHFTYELADTEVLQVAADSGRIEVPTPSDDGQWGVVVRGKDLGAGMATVFINAEPVLRIRGDERSALYPIPFHAGGHITVNATDAPGGEVSLGLYEKTGSTVGAGVSHAGKLFPATYGGATLLGGEFGDPDDTVVRYSFLHPGRPITLAAVCLDPTATFEVRYQIDGKDVGFGDCSGEPLSLSAPDLAISNLLRPDQVSPGRHTATIAAVRRDGSTEPVGDDAPLMGIAVYEEGEQVQVGAMKIDKITEQYGRRWQVDRVVPVSKTREFSTEVVTGGRPAMIGYQTCGWAVAVQATSRDLGHRTDGSTITDDAGGCGFSVGDQLLAYDTYDVALESDQDRQGTAETFSGAVVVYRPVD